MGRPKMWLPFGGEPLLLRVVRILEGAVGPVVVVAAAGQDVPPLPEGVELVRDEHPDRGPLAGLMSGLAALEGRAVAAYASSCDAPLLRPEFVRAVVDRLGDHDLAMPRDGRFHHPLAAVYRMRLHATIREMLDAGIARPVALLDHCRAVEVPVDDLRAADPWLDSLRNTNTPEEYQAALTAAGFPADA
jgi:molybdopterin-guanine dinucleotide biosynthesis protein A